MSDDRTQKESGPDVKSFYEGIVHGQADKDKDKFLYVMLGYVFGRRR